MRSAKRFRILLADLVHDYLPGNYVVPLNIGLLSSYLRRTFGGDVAVQLFKSPTSLLDAVRSGPAPDLVGFSNYSWNQELNAAVVERTRALAPKAIICAGGPHIRTNAAGIAEYLQQHPSIDFYCMLEGEQPIGALVYDLLAHEESDRAVRRGAPLPNVAYLQDSRLVYQAVEFRKGTIEDIPSPYLDGVLDEFIASTKWIPLLETNRGCPFHCTFCVWGISAMDNVRVFPLDRVLEEIRFVAKRSPSPRWIFADANFGMLARDVEIAKEIRRVADQYGRLSTAYLWWAKNSSHRTVEIAKILGPLSDPLAAVQTLDETVLRNIKRENIKLTTMTDLVTQFHSDNLKATTDVLVGLPGESREMHLATLRQVFALGFDHIDVGNIRMLPGSEMESDKTRHAYDLLTKYRLIAGSYGTYEGTPVFEFEESVRASKDISEDEMHSLRFIHFGIWALWNLGIAKPVLRGAQLSKGRNPLDVILAVAGAADGCAAEFIQSFDAEAREEWFDSPEELRDFYTSHFDRLVEEGFLKLNFKYLAKLLLDRGLTHALMNAVQKAAGVDDPEIVRFALDRVRFFDEHDLSTKTRSYSPRCVEMLKVIYPGHVFQSTECTFSVDAKVKRDIDYELKRFRVEHDPLRALALTLEVYRHQFMYSFSFGAASQRESVGDLTGSFDYQAPFGPA